MVSVSFSPHVERSDRLHQSVDLAIRDLLGGGADPLAKATYLWAMRRHDKSLINSDALVVWALSWARQILVGGETSRRRDEEVASAALAAAALTGTKEFSSIRGEMRAGVKTALDEELKRNGIPFRRAPYAAALLYGAHSLGVEAEGFRNAVVRTGESFRDAIAGGRLFGLHLVVRTLRDLEEENLAREIGEAIREALADPKTGYEDQAYLLQALWESLDGVPDESVMAATERVLAKSPAWGYLMNGAEDVPPAGDGHTVVYVSHLYRAALLDVTARYQAYAAARAEAKVDERHKGRFGVVWLAFWGVVLSFVGACVLLTAPLYLYANAAGRFWLGGHLDAMNPLPALLYILGTLALMYVLIAAAFVIPEAYRVFVLSQIASDKRIKDLLGAKLRHAAVWWFVSLIFAVGVEVYSSVISLGMQHLLKRETWGF